MNSRRGSRAQVRTLEALVAVAIVAGAAGTLQHYTIQQTTVANAQELLDYLVYNGTIPQGLSQPDQLAIQLSQLLAGQPWKLEVFELMRGSLNLVFEMQSGSPSASSPAAAVTYSPHVEVYYLYAT